MKRLNKKLLLNSNGIIAPNVIVIIICSDFSKGNLEKTITEKKPNGTGNM
jgi:hypothetical protein